MAIFLALTVLTINISATIACVRSGLLSTQQKWLQIVFVWVVPVVGGVISLLMHFEGQLKPVPDASRMDTDDAWSLTRAGSVDDAQHPSHHDAGP